MYAQLTTQMYSAVEFPIIIGSFCVAEVDLLRANHDDYNAVKGNIFMH